MIIATVLLTLALFLIAVAIWASMSYCAIEAYREGDKVEGVIMGILALALFLFISSMVVAGYYGGIRDRATQTGQVEVSPSDDVHQVWPIVLEEPNQ